MKTAWSRASSLYELYELAFESGMKKTFWQIGNAVPVVLARHIALAIREGLRGLDCPQSAQRPYEEMNSK